MNIRARFGSRAVVSAVPESVHDPPESLMNSLSAFLTRRNNDHLPIYIRQVWFWRCHKSRYSLILSDVMLLAVFEQLFVASIVWWNGALFNNGKTSSTSTTALWFNKRNCPRGTLASTATGMSPRLGESTPFHLLLIPVFSYCCPGERRWGSKLGHKFDHNDDIVLHCGFSKDIGFGPETVCPHRTNTVVAPKPCKEGETTICTVWKAKRPSASCGVEKWRVASFCELARAFDLFELELLYFRKLRF